MKGITALLNKIFRRKKYSSLSYKLIEAMRRGIENKQSIECYKDRGLISQATYKEAINYLTKLKTA